MKIVMVSGEYPPVQSGESNHSLYLAQKLAERGVELHVLTSAMDDVPHADGFSVHPIMRRWDWSETIRLRRFLKQLAPDAILLMYMRRMYRGHGMITFSATLAKSLFPNLRFVTHFNQVRYSMNRRPSIIEKAGRWLATRTTGKESTDRLYGSLLRDSDRVMVLAEEHCDYLKSHDPTIGERAMLVPPPPILNSRSDSQAARDEGRSRLGVDERDFVLVYYGFIYRSKGLELAIRALAQLKKSNHSAHLVVAGGLMDRDPPQRLADSQSYLQELKQLSCECGVDDRIHWLGATPSDSTIPTTMLHAADAHVFPFVNGVHLNNSSVASATMHGKPLITTRGETTESAFVHGENSMLSAPNDVDGYYESIRRTIDDNDLRRQLTEGVNRLSQMWFSWDTVVDRTLDSLRDPSTTTYFPNPV